MKLYWGITRAAPEGCHVCYPAPKVVLVYFENGPLLFSNQATGVETGQYYFPQKNILRTENKWCTVVLQSITARGALARVVAGRI
jgi:hypothetical protein